MPAANTVTVPLATVTVTRTCQRLQEVRVTHWQAEAWAQRSQPSRVEVGVGRRHGRQTTQNNIVVRWSVWATRWPASVSLACFKFPLSPHNSSRRVSPTAQANFAMN